MLKPTTNPNRPKTSPRTNDETANIGEPLKTILSTRKKTIGNTVNTIGAPKPANLRFLPRARSDLVTSRVANKSLILKRLLYKQCVLNSN